MRKVVFIVYILFIIGNSCISMDEKGYSIEELEKNTELLRKIATKITQEKGVIENLQVSLNQKHSKPSYSLWVSYNDNNKFPLSENLDKDIYKKIENFTKYVKSGENQNKTPSNFRKWLRTRVGLIEFTLLEDDTISKIGDIIKESVLKSKIIKLRAPTLGTNNIKDIIEVTYEFDKPFGLKYIKENGKSEKINIIEKDIPRKTIVIAFKASPYIKELLNDKNALEVMDIKGGSILSAY
jgi:hypothetical protein